MAGFYGSSDKDICEPYFDKFYEYLPQLYIDHTQKFIEAFFYGMLPRKNIEDKHIVRLLVIKSQVADTNKLFSNLLQDGIELLIMSKTIREFALSR